MDKSSEEVFGMKLQDRMINAQIIRGELIESGTIVRAVKCDFCDTLHIEDNNTYLRLIGNLHMGNAGGLLGNGDWKKYGIPVSIYCVESNCMSRAIKSIEDKELGYKE